MFSFHKPKIYRSIHGCCICRAKSSSSRFTDSKRYESDFSKCFRIKERRSGEICNACVLLVKRWKKLPSGSTRNWHHVVDARAGPGTKSIVKIKSKTSRDDKFNKKHHSKTKLKLNKQKSQPPCSPGGLSDDIIMDEDYFSDHSSTRSGNSSPILSDLSDDEHHNLPGKVRERKRKCQPIKVNRQIKISPFLDLSYWKKTKICCGIIFMGSNGEVLVDQQLLRPCQACRPSKTTTPVALTVATTQEPEFCTPTLEGASSPPSLLATGQEEIVNSNILPISC